MRGQESECEPTFSTLQPFVFIDLNPNHAKEVICFENAQDNVSKIRKRGKERRYEHIF